MYSHGTKHNEISQKGTGILDVPLVCQLAALASLPSTLGGHIYTNHLAHRLCLTSMRLISYSDLGMGNEKPDAWTNKTKCHMIIQQWCTATILPQIIHRACVEFCVWEGAWFTVWHNNVTESAQMTCAACQCCRCWQCVEWSTALPP